MKRLYYSLIVIFLIVIMISFCNSKIKSITEELYLIVEQSVKLYEKNNFDSAKSLMELFGTRLEKHRKFLMIFGSSEYADNLIEYFFSLEESLYSNSDYLLNAKKTLYYLKKIERSATNIV